MKRGIRFIFALCAMLLVAFGTMGEGSLSFLDDSLTLTPGAVNNLRYLLPENAQVTLVLLDQEGKGIHTFFTDQAQEAGQKAVRWDGRLAGGSVLPLGEYRLVLTAGGQEATLTVTAGEAAPILADVLPDNDLLSTGDKLTISFDASVAGSLEVTLLGVEEGQWPLGETQVSPGENHFSWDGTVPGESLKAGTYRVSLRLLDGDGEASLPHEVLIELGAPAVAQAQDTPQAVAAPPWQPISHYPDPHENCYWQMDIQNLDPENEADQAKIWEIMMQPIIVVDVDPKEHLYPVKEPGLSTKERENVTGQLHGGTQGVHVIREEGGWTLIEAYSNDGYRAPWQSLQDLSDQLITGWVPSKKLKSIKPYAKMGLLVDKLRQTMYIFEDGKVTGTLLVSTGKPTKDSPNNETTSGEFITDSWVGEFESGNMRCDLAIRINGGVLIHEVPYKPRADGTRDYSAFIQYLGKKASHGCVRVQRAQNDQGQNMKWLWENLKKKTKVLIWDDDGRSLPPPDPSTVIYYNDNGKGEYYHALERCPLVKERWWPLSPFSFGELDNAPYDKLTPCPRCSPPLRVNTEVPDDIIGGETDF